MRHLSKPPVMTTSLADDFDAITRTDREFSAVKRDMMLSCTITMEQAYKLVQAHDRIMVLLKTQVGDLIQSQREMGAKLSGIADEMTRLHQAGEESAREVIAFKTSTVYPLFEVMEQMDAQAAVEAAAKASYP